MYMYREVSYHIDAEACHWSLVDYRSRFCRNELPQIISLLYSSLYSKKSCSGMVNVMLFFMY